jgi:hypothetical protein
MQDSPIVAQDPYSMFLFALKAPETRRKYTGHLDTFLEFIDDKSHNTPKCRHRRTEVDLKRIREKCRFFVEEVRKDNNWALYKVIEFLQFLRDQVDKKEIVAGTLKNYCKAIRVFCEMSEIELPWKRITRGLPRPKRYASDRVPTMDEVRKLVEYPDRRIKAIVYSMISSGIRLGSWDYLRWGHCQPNVKDGKIMAVTMKVYAGEPEEYFTFMTPSAWEELVKWKNYRQDCGEEVTDDSWVMRNLWDVTTLPHAKERNDYGMDSGIGKGLATLPKKLKSQGVKRLLLRALYAQGLRRRLPTGKKRHEFQGIHSLRKICQTQLEIAGLKNVNVQTLMGRSLGVNDSYYRVTIADLLTDYEKAIPLLTIDDTTRLQDRVNSLEEKQDDVSIMKLEHQRFSNACMDGIIKLP